MDFQPLRNHSLWAHTMTALGVTLQGFAENDAFDCARNEESFKLVVGADGSGTRYDTNRRDGRITFHLMGSSLVNNAFAAAVLADESGTGLAAIGPIFIRNRNGNLVLECEQAWIVKPADVSIGAAPKPRDWIFETANLRTFPGN